MNDDYQNGDGYENMGKIPHTVVTYWPSKTVIREDKRLDCVHGDRGGRYGEYYVLNPDGTRRTDVMMTFDLDADFQYPWVPTKLYSDGRMASGIYNSYHTSKDACDAIEDGSWQDVNN